MCGWNKRYGNYILNNMTHQYKVLSTNSSFGGWFCNFYWCFRRYNYQNVVIAWDKTDSIVNIDNSLLCLATTKLFFSNFFLSCLIKFLLIMQASDNENPHFICYACVDGNFVIKMTEKYFFVCVVFIKRM